MGAEVLGLLGINKLQLARGAHRTRDEGVCLMEAVAWFTDGPHTDRPACVDPVLGAFGRGLNDLLSDEDRQALVDLIPKLVGTSGDSDLSRRRAYLLVDRVIRQILPLAFEQWLEQWPEHARAMRECAEVKDLESALSARNVCRAAADAAARAARAADRAAYAYAASASAAAADRAAYAAAATYHNQECVRLVVQAFIEAIDLR